MKLKDPHEVELIKKNIPKFDVMINSFRLGVMDRLVLGYEDIKAIKPDIIYVQLSAFGSKPSTYQSKPAYDIVAASMSGICGQTGEPDSKGGHPMRLGPVISYMAGAEACHAATVTALFHHERTGEGQFVDVPFLRNMIHLNASLELLDKEGHQLVRTGNRTATMSPYGIYTGKTMSMVIAAVSPSTWDRLCDRMGREDLKTDVKIKDLSPHTANHEYVENLVTDWLMSFDDTHEAYDMIGKAGVPCCPVFEAQDVWDNEVFNDEFDWFVNYPMYPEWEGSEVQSNKLCPWFADFSAEPCDTMPRHLAPYIGEQNYDILEEWGCTESQAKELSTDWKAQNV